MTSDFGERICRWWIDLLTSHGFHFESLRQALNSESKIAVSVSDNIVCLKYPTFRYPPRHYFFGRKQETEHAFLYAFVPEITHAMRPELKETFSEELGFLINSSLNGEDRFADFFTLPIQISHDAMNFDGKNYQGVAVNTRVRESELDDAALECWRKNVFVPFCRFLDDGFDDYFVKKGE